MRSSQTFLGPSEAASRVGVSVKALRLYEKRGLIAPLRTASGWRAYGPDQIERAAEIAALRALGLGLALIRTILGVGDAERSSVLAAHGAVLQRELGETSERIATLHRLRAGHQSASTPLSGAPAISFDLPWPWAGERFELAEPGPLTFIVGPLFSGKTRLAQAIADRLPGAVFVGLDRRTPGKPASKARVGRAVARLVANGATASVALTALVEATEAHPGKPLVIDMVEQGLDAASQAAMIADLGERAREAGPVFVMTRSLAVLDPSAIGPGEAIIFCPANHNPPYYVAPVPGASGFEALASCLGTPEARARTEGVIAIRRQVA